MDEEHRKDIEWMQNPKAQLADSRRLAMQALAAFDPKATSFMRATGLSLALGKLIAARARSRQELILLTELISNTLTLDAIMEFQEKEDGKTKQG